MADLSELCQLYVGNMTLPNNTEYEDNKKYKWLKNTHDNQQFILDIIKTRKYTLDNFKVDNYDDVYMTIINNNMLVLKYIVEELGLNLSKLKISRLLRYALYANSLDMFIYVITKARISRIELFYKDSKIIHKILYCDSISLSNKERIFWYLFELVCEF